MSINLYELTLNYKNLEELLDNPEIPDYLLSDALKEINETFELKVENIAKVIRGQELDVIGLKEEIDRLTKIKRTKENRITYLKQYLKDNMQALDKLKVKGKLFTISVQNSAPSVEIKDLTLIPKEFIRIIEEPSKKEILAELKDGKAIEGAELKVSKSLRIR